MFNRQLKKALFSIILIILFSSFTFSQSDSLKGIVVNKETGSPISNVYLLNPDGAIITITNSAGEFYLDKESANNEITFYHLGYRKKSVAVKQGLSIIELEPSPINLGEVTVISTKHEKLKKEISMPVEVVEEGKILRSPSVTPPDLLKNEPGISLSRDGIWSTEVSIRGLNRENVVTLIDGNRIATSTDVAARFSLVDMSDIERIEVIKGASSSIYGSGATGGIVNIITKSPGLSLSREQAGSNFSIKGNVNIGFNSVNNLSTTSATVFSSGSVWASKISASFRKAGDTQTPVGKLKNSQFEDYSFSGNLNIAPVDNHLIKLNYQRFKAIDVGIPGASVFPANADVRYPDEKRELISAAYDIQSISSLLYNLSVKYSYQLINRNVENIPHTVQNVPATGTTPARRVSVLKITPEAEHKNNNIQVQGNLLLAENNILIAGFDYWDRNYNGKRGKYQLIEALNTEGNVVSTTNKVIVEKPLPDSKLRSYGFFAQDDMVLFKDKLSLSLGARIDKIDVSGETTLNPLYDITNGVRNDSPAGQTKIWDAIETDDVSWSGNLSLLYSLYPDVDLTFTIARSFRSPSLEERFQYIDQGNLVKVGDPNLQPEKGTFIDAGLRIWQQDFTFTGSIFFNQLNDLVSEKPGTFDGRNALLKSNIGKARLYGFDFGTEYNFLSEWIIYSVLSYVRGEDIEKDENLPQIPPLNGRLGFRAPVFGYFYFDLSSTLFAKQGKTAPGEIKTLGYATFDLYVNTIPIKYSLINLQFYAGIENIMDKSYRNHLATNRGFIMSEPGRNFFAKIKVGW
jgi:hemoglobin/transferrin/lactoferrin receptor protein